MGTLAGGPGCSPLVHGAYPPQTDSHGASASIRSLAGFGTPLGALAPPVALPPADSREASLKAISGRTSYLRTRLAFHSYPQLIPWFFSTSGFGPPSGVTRTSTWPWVDRRVSGLLPATKRPIRTRFPYGSTSRLSLATESNSLAHYAKGTPSEELTPPPRPLVGTRFQARFHSPTRVSFLLSLTVLCAIGRQRVLSLGGWSPLIPAGFLVSRGTWDRTPGRGSGFAYGAFTLYGWPSQTIRLPKPFVTPRGVRSLLQARPSTPGGQRLRALSPTQFGLFPFRSPLLRESRLISFPPPTKMFQFGGYRLPASPG